MNGTKNLAILKGAGHKEWRKWSEAISKANMGECVKDRRTRHVSGELSC